LSESLEERKGYRKRERRTETESRRTVLWSVWERMKKPSFGLLSIYIVEWVLFGPYKKLGLELIYNFSTVSYILFFNC
jgi:hypothetical protein